MSEEILVSICVQTYQHERFIGECLDGLVSQETNFKYEIIIGEDGGEDETYNICKKYAERHPNLIQLFKRKREDVIRIAGNATGRYNFIKNLEVSRGKYIALCPGDDYWVDKFKLQKQVDFLEENPDHVISFTNLNILNLSNGEKVSAYGEKDAVENGVRSLKKPEKTSLSGEELYRGNFLHTPTVMFRNLFQNNSTPDFYRLTTIGDWPIYMYVLKDGGRIHFLDEITSVYRTHHGGIYSKQSESKKLFMSLGQYPPMINSGEFSADIIDVWKENMLGLFIRLLKAAPAEDPYLLKALEMYEREMPEWMNTKLWPTWKKMSEKKREKAVKKSVKAKVVSAFRKYLSKK